MHCIIGCNTLYSARYEVEQTYDKTKHSTNHQKITKKPSLYSLGTSSSQVKVNKICFITGPPRNVPLPIRIFDMFVLNVNTQKLRYMYDNIVPMHVLLLKTTPK